MRANAQFCCRSLPSCCIFYVRVKLSARYGAALMRLPVHKQPSSNQSGIAEQHTHTSVVVLVQKEASEVFFSVTKLFQNKDANLRRMVYLVIKDVCPSADEVIIITSSLMKDMNSKTDLYRSNAIRVLCSITDTQLLAQIERSVLQLPHLGMQ